MRKLGFFRDDMAAVPVLQALQKRHEGAMDVVGSPKIKLSPQFPPPMLFVVARLGQRRYARGADTDKKSMPISRQHLPNMRLEVDLDATVVSPQMSSSNLEIGPSRATVVVCGHEEARCHSRWPAAAARLHSYSSIREQVNLLL